MAMSFYGANRPMNPDMQQAAMQQAELAGLLRQQKMGERAGYLQGGIELAGMVPEGAWSGLGSSLGMGEAAAAGDAAAAATGATNPGVMSSLGALGPWGWGALAALALGMAG
jgi:hypothetical protein